MQKARWVGSVPPDMPWGHKVQVSVDGWILLVNPDVLQLAGIYHLVAGKVTESELALKVQAAIERGLEQTLASHFTQVANGGLRPDFCRWRVDLLATPRSN